MTKGCFSPTSNYHIYEILNAALLFGVVFIVAYKPAIFSLFLHDRQHCYTTILRGEDKLYLWGCIGEGCHPFSYLLHLILCSMHMRESNPSLFKFSFRISAIDREQFSLLEFKSYNSRDREIIEI